MISPGPHFDLPGSFVEVNLCQHNGNKPPHVKSAIRKQDLGVYCVPARLTYAREFASDAPNGSPWRGHVCTY